MAHPARLRKVGGAVMVAIPKPMLDALDLAAGAAVTLAVEAGRLVVAPKPRRRYSLDELLAQCERSRRRPRPGRDWVSGKPAGRELI